MQSTSACGQFSETELRDLADRALPLHRRWQERLFVHEGHCEPAAARRLTTWRHLLCVDGDEAVIARRLAWEGRNLHTGELMLGGVRLSPDAPLPAWATRLNTLLRGCPSQVDSLRGHLADSLPFAHVWLAFIAGATDELRTRAGTTLDNLGDGALRSFQEELLYAVAQLGALSLSLEFRRFVTSEDPLSLFRAADPGTAIPSRRYYDRFVAHLASGGLLGFFQKYPVLARLVSETAVHWAEHVSEFCLRYAEDRAELWSLLNDGVDPGPVVDVVTGLSDPHHGQRTVVAATFACGLKVVYKPKDLAVDKAFWRFIAWLGRDERDGDLLPLRTLTVLNRSTYGWVEFVEHEACRDRPAIQRYYRRIGALLCVGYVLGATDLHHENIMAAGEHPVVLDLETLLQPMPRSFDGLRALSADERAHEIMHDSVLRVGLLPFWIAGDRGKSYDVSGIGAEETPDSGKLQIDWHDVNTDGMRFEYRSVTSDRAIDRPMLDDHLASARGYSDAIVDGFTAAYRSLLARRDSLLEADGPLTGFRGVTLRYLLRMTKAYAQLTNRRMYPEFLGDGADASLELERLARDFLLVQPRPECPVPWGTFRAEAEALERLDVPLFAFHSDSVDLYADGSPVAQHFFSETGMQRAAGTIRKLSEGDLRVQTNLIRASLHARYAADGIDGERPPEDDGARPADREQSLTAEQFVDAAVAIAEQIRATAIRGSDGSITWLSMAFDPIVRRTNFLPMNDTLYDGRPGVAVFLAALEHVSGGAGFRDLARDALVQLCKTLRAAIPPPPSRVVLGGAGGLGGQIYAMARVAAWLSDDDLLGDAARAVDWFTPKRVQRDETLDVCGGAAGGILGLLTLSGHRGSHALDAAVRCGDHVLRKRVVSDTGHRVWRGDYVCRPLTGFGHGAAGIAYALLRLSQASGETRFRDAAEEAIEYETAVYMTGVSNWPDFRENPEGSNPMVAWCNGAAGIGLGRLGGLAMFDTDRVRQDIDNALATTRIEALRGEDHLCCGSMGRIDFLIESGRRLGRVELLDEARQRASLVVRRAARKRQYKLLAQAPGVADSLSLFQGTAGIGYQLLRLAHPERLPSVLLWE